MKVALYARVSTALKLERQDPDTQLLPLREFCERRGWEPAEIYVDDISAVKRRPAYDRMLAEARGGRRFSTIVIVRLDRMFRSMEEFARVVAQLNQWNIRLVCTDHEHLQVLQGRARPSDPGDAERRPHHPDDC